MFNGKNKAVTFSFDDGITQDIRIIQILDKYGLKATFNLNSELLALDGTLNRNDKIVTHIKVSPDKVEEIYRNHEVAVHTLTHPSLIRLNVEDIIFQIEQDRRNLSELCGYDVVGMAYPFGETNDRVVAAIKENTGVKYARTVTPTYNFDLQNDLFRFNPTLHCVETKKLFELAKDFLEANDNKPSLFYIWGHGFDFDAFDCWDTFDEFCKLISGHKNVFYGTNKEVFL